MSSPTVGVVVPCKNEAGTIARCLESLRAQRPTVSRIVVVDNGSTDGSVEVARRLADEVVEVRGGSIAGLRNLGAGRLSDADVIGFVDADCEVGPGWLAAGLDALGGAGLVGSRSLAAPDAPWVARRWAAIEAGQAHDQSKVWSQHLLIRAPVLARLGGFDEALATGEDSDLSQRAVVCGDGVALVDGMVAIHHGFPGSVPAFLRRERWHTRAPGWFPRMSPKSKALVLGAAAWLTLGAVATGVSLASRDVGALVTWTGSSMVLVPILGAVGTRSLRTAVPDGVLLALWSIVRAGRLPGELVRPSAAARTVATVARP